MLRLEPWLHDADACLCERSKAKKLERADGVGGVGFAAAALGVAAKTEDAAATAGVGAGAGAAGGRRGGLSESVKSAASTGNEAEAEVEAGA